MKNCFKCNVDKPLEDFYKHPRMTDGRLGKCKECNKKDVINNRKSKVEYYREYDRNRGNRQTPEYHEEYRAKYPAKYKARYKANNAIRDGLLDRGESCETCGSTQHIHAHHDDYSEPLSVRWLCAAHHFQWHSDNGQGLNGE